MDEYLLNLVGSRVLRNKREGLRWAKMKMFWELKSIHYPDCNDGFMEIYNRQVEIFKIMHFIYVSVLYCMSIISQ